LEFRLSVRIDWGHHLAQYAKLLDIDPIPVKEYCENNGLPFASAKRHISAKKARLHLTEPEKNKAPSKKTAKKPNKNGSTTILKRAAKKPSNKVISHGAPVGNKNSRTTGRSDRLRDIPATTIKEAVINMEEDDINSSRPLERTLTVLYAQFENLLRNQHNMQGAIDHLYDAGEMPTIDKWNEGETHILKKYRCDGATGSSLAAMADTISQVQKRQVEILLKRRELSAYTRIEELQIINGAYEDRMANGLTATETVRIIENFGLTPPLSLAKEMEREITFLEPPAPPEVESISDADLEAEVVNYTESLGSQLENLYLEGSPFSGGIDLGHENSDELLEESDFE
jgi:hypothetical protein